MVVMGFWAFILCTGHRWRKTKEQQPWNNTKQIFPGPWTKNKEQKIKKSHLCPAHEVLSGIGNPLISGQIVNSFGQGKCTFDCLGLSETIPLATMSQQAHPCWELRNWPTSTRLVCGHCIQIPLLHGYLFLCMYKNKWEHFHKWFGTL